ncbi:MAG: glycosyltransferase family 39 protein [Flavobacteriales bacterium]|nr:glycosyltransferase family 39 protein [Flavobacteriales bacterium]
MGRRDYLLLFVILLVNVLVKLPGLGHSSFDLDEAVHLWNAQKPLSDIIAHAADDPNPPLYNILISFWIKAFGVDEAPARWFSLLFSALGAGAMFVFLKRNFNVRLALMAVTLFTLSAVQLKFAHNARPYSMMVFFMVCSYGLMLESLRRPSAWNLAGYAMATALMLYAHPTSVFNLPAQGLFLLIHLRQHRATVIKAGASLALAAATYLVWHVNISFFKSGTGTWLAPPDLDDVLLAISQLNVGDQLFWLQCAIAVTAVLLLVRFREKEMTMPIVLGLLWTVLPFVGNFAFSHVSDPIFQAKYVLSAQVGMTVLMAACISVIRWPFVQGAVLSTLAVTMFHLMDWKVTSGEDWRAATDIVKADEGPRTATFVSPWFQFQTFAYHYDRNIYRDPDTTQSALVARRVFTAWHDIVPEGSDRPLYARVHFVESQSGVENQQQRLDSLRANAHLVAEHHLEGINIYTFDLRIPPPQLHLDFEEEHDGLQVLEGDKEFSSVILVPLDLTFGSDTTLVITAKVRSGGGLDQVFLVASFINDGDYVVHVQAGADPGQLGSTEWQTISTEMRYEWAKHGASGLKTFVWNPSRRRVEVDDLEVSLPTP